LRADSRDTNIGLFPVVDKSYESQRYDSGNGIRVERHTPDGSVLPISKPNSSPTISARGVGTRFNCSQNEFVGCMVDGEMDGELETLE
jgi:hypothetical protein